MIQNFSDHAANERTFLAWVRTAITIMAFGFVIERFDLFLLMAGQTLTSQHLQIRTTGFSHVAGPALILLGTAMTITAGTRFVLTARAIDKKEIVPGTGSRIDVALALLLALLGLAMLAYLSHGLIEKS
jgi:inner membrane protein YidH